MTQLERISPSDFDDFKKNKQIIIKVQEYKAKLNNSEADLKELEDIIAELVQKLSEQDIEKSVDLIGMKIKELEDRLYDNEHYLQRIKALGKDMDGNTSNGEEDEFIFATKNELPDVFQNIETTFSVLKDTKVLIKDVQKTLNL